MTYLPFQSRKLPQDTTNQDFTASNLGLTAANQDHPASSQRTCPPEPPKSCDEPVGGLLRTWTRQVRISSRQVRISSRQVRITIELLRTTLAPVSINHWPATNQHTAATNQAIPATSRLSTAQNLLTSESPQSHHRFGAATSRNEPRRNRFDASHACDGATHGCPQPRNSRYRAGPSRIRSFNVLAHAATVALSGWPGSVTFPRHPALSTRFKRKVTTLLNQWRRMMGQIGKPATCNRPRLWTSFRYSVSSDSLVGGFIYFRRDGDNAIPSAFTPVLPRRRCGVRSLKGQQP